MASSIEKARQQQRMTRLNFASKIARTEHTMFASAAATVLGLAEGRGHKLPTIAGIDGQIVFGAAALFLADNNSNGMERFFQSLADTLLGIGLYNLGKTYGTQNASAGGVGDATAMDALLSAGIGSMRDAA